MVFAPVTPLRMIISQNNKSFHVIPLTLVAMVVILKLHSVILNLQAGLS